LALGQQGCVFEPSRSDTRLSRVIGVQPCALPSYVTILCEADLPNLSVTPHVAWARKEAMQMLAYQLVDDVEAFVARKPQNVVE
ncbi:glycerate dehydrogenase, partial [Methylobacterium sp. E-005]|nr:glycerate dehydrogenase [Methylobacterium sp. E-005]